jgi:hypothetical protein
MEEITLAEMKEYNERLDIGGGEAKSWKDVPEQYQTIAKFYETDLIPYLKKTF